MTKDEVRVTVTDWMPSRYDLNIVARKIAFGAPRGRATFGQSYVVPNGGQQRMVTRFRLSESLIGVQ